MLLVITTAYDWLNLRLHDVLEETTRFERCAGRTWFRGHRMDRARSDMELFDGLSVLSCQCSCGGHIACCIEQHSDASWVLKRILFSTCSFGTWLMRRHRVDLPKARLYTGPT
jgi:hypothetical protein